MTKDFQILPEAWKDIIKISSYYYTISEDLLLKYEKFLFEAFENIRTLPKMYPIKYKYVRRKLMKKFPYAIYFYEHKSFIRIIAVIHQKENPKTIKSQIRDRNN